MKSVGRFFRSLGNLIDKLSQYFLLGAGGATVLLAFVIAYNTTRRYIFNSQDNYAYVLSCFLTIVCICLAFADTQRQQQHLRVDLFDKYFPKSVVNTIRYLISPIIMLGAIYLIVWQCWDSTWFALTTGEISYGGATRIVSWPGRMVIPISFAMFGLVVIVQLVRYIASLVRKGEKAAKTPEVTGNTQS